MAHATQQIPDFTREKIQEHMDLALHTRSAYSLNILIKLKQALMDDENYEALTELQEIEHRNDYIIPVAIPTF